MHLFTDYLEPLTVWINANPSWALFITFLISLSESLAIIGSIIPGSVTMTAIGILAGSGVMRVDLTLVAAALGAVAGDSASYFLGSTFRNTLPNIWPFSRYPTWLRYGKEYFAKHGGKSVLIGRFIGPLRSIIPLIAGMMHMNRWQFLVANVISAVGWAIVYVMPGVLIGAASTELSAESASRLFLVILILLVFAWLASLFIKWLIKHINLFFRESMHNFWIWSLKHPKLAFYSSFLTPEYEKNHYATAGTIVLFAFSLIVSIIITLIVSQYALAETINEPIRYFIQTLQTSYFISFFVVINLFISPFSLLALYLSIPVYSLYHRDWRVLIFWLSLGVSSALITFFLYSSIIFQPIETSLSKIIYISYPDINITFATALFGFLIFYINTRYRTVITLAIRILLLSLLFLAGIGTVYLSDNWFSNVLGAYFIGFTICLIHWIFFRRISQFQNRSHIPIIFSCLILIIASTIVTFYEYKPLIQAHRLTHKQYFISPDSWWNQKQPLLPLYATNRIGKQTALFNMQYSGDMQYFADSLTTYGWKKQTFSFFNSILHKVNGSHSSDELPLTAQLYQNTKPYLIMTYSLGNDYSFLILRLWQSNYYLQSVKNPIWIGSVHLYHSKKRKISTPEITNYKELFEPIISALSGIQLKTIYLKHNKIQSLPHTVPPVIMLINVSSA